jgi:hypothetical protein
VNSRNILAPRNVRRERERFRVPRELQREQEKEGREIVEKSRVVCEVHRDFERGRWSSAAVGR